MKKYCTKCGHEFEAVGREVICPSCKATAAEETKRAAVLRAKRASWTGESVPVRISGRASTVIREYGAAHNLPFAAALDALLNGSEFFASTGKAWEDVTPYKSRRRDKHATADNEQDATETASKPQDKPQDAQDAQDVPHVAKASKTTSKTTSKTATSKSTSKPSKASKSTSVK